MAFSGRVAAWYLRADDTWERRTLDAHGKPLPDFQEEFIALKQERASAMPAPVESADDFRPVFLGTGL
jgi:hypothetical protein